MDHQPRRLRSGAHSVEPIAHRAPPYLPRTSSASAERQRAGARRAAVSLGLRILVVASRRDCTFACGGPQCGLGGFWLDGGAGS
eukprot:6262151-Prymnesium_polylepis.2